MEIRKLNSPNRNVGRQGWVPDYIACHITESSSLEGALSWLMNASAQVSYHFVVSRGGELIQLVDIENTAWANGTDNGGGIRDNRFSTVAAVRERRQNANLYTVSIGFEGRFSDTRGGLTDAQLEAGIWLMGFISREVRRIYRHDIPAEKAFIIGHNEITPRNKPNCPGASFPYERIIRGLDGGGDEGPEDWAEEAWQWAVRRGITDGTRPREGATRQEMVTMIYRALR
jgi:N-acetyl-anhydromuramyl-L-alanine amidase AmpD